MAMLTKDDRAAVAAARVARVESIGAAIVKNDMNTAVVMSRGAELTFRTPDEIMELASKSPEDLASLGWTHEDLAIAVDSRVATGQVPFYLRVAHDRLLAYMHRAPTNVAARASVVAIPVSSEFHGDYDEAPADTKDQV